MKSDIFKLLHIIKERHPECSIDWRRDVTVNPMMGMTEAIVGQQRLTITFPYDVNLDPLNSPISKTVRYCGFNLNHYNSVYYGDDGIDDITLEIII
jgi:hypothetical protein